MTTETDPMVRVLSVKCSECGYDYNATSSKGNWNWTYPVPAKFIREQRAPFLHHCKKGCKKATMMLFATEPVR